MTISSVQGPRIWINNNWYPVVKINCRIQKCLALLGEEEKRNFKPAPGEFFFCNLSLSSVSRNAFLTYVKGCKDLLKYPIELDLEVLDWVYVEAFMYKPFMECILIAAAAKGKLPFLYWAKEKGIQLPKEALVAAARNGQLHVVKWLHHWGLRGNVAQIAAAIGDVSMLEWAVIEGGYPCDTQVLFKAVESNQKGPLIWAHSQNIVIRSDLSCTAAAMGHCDALEFLMDIGCENEDLTWEAASSGKLGTLKWLVENRELKPQSADIYRAAQNGHVDVVRYLNDRGVSFEDGMMRNYLNRCLNPKNQKQISEILNVLL